MLETIIKIPTLWSQSGKNYHFTDDGIYITVDTLAFEKTVIAKSDLVSLRFGVKWIKGLYVPIGRHFFIELKLNDGTVIPIKFSSYYGIKKQLYTERYQELINAVWEYIFKPDFFDVMARFKRGEELYISDVEIDRSGVSWDGKEKLPWDKIELSSYRTYFVIKHTDNYKFNTSRNFLNDWDSYLLQQVSKAIIKQRAEIADRKFKVNLN
jgi:hypothetical protein